MKKRIEFQDKKNLNIRVSNIVVFLFFMKNYPE